MAAIAAVMGALSNTLRLELVDLTGMPTTAAAFIGALTAGLLASLSKTYVPHLGILFTGAVILLITIFGSFGFVVRTATFTILLYYSIANVAAIRQPREEQIYGRIIPWLGLAGCVAMSVSLPFMVIVYGISLLAIGFVIRFFVKLTGPSAV